MAQHDDAPLADVLAEVVGDADTKALFRRLREALNELIESELIAVIGAERHERTNTRTNQRNGARPRVLSTPAGDVELRIPKVKTESFFPSMLEPRRRVDRALWAVIMTAYVHAPGLLVAARRSGGKPHRDGGAAIEHVNGAGLEARSAGEPHEVWEPVVVAVGVREQPACSGVGAEREGQRRDREVGVGACVWSCQ